MLNLLATILMLAAAADAEPTEGPRIICRRVARIEINHVLQRQEFGPYVGRIGADWRMVHRFVQAIYWGRGNAGDVCMGWSMDPHWPVRDGADWIVVFEKTTYSWGPEQRIQVRVTAPEIRYTLTSYDAEIAWAGERGSLF